MTPPHIPEESPAVLPEEDVHRLLKAASGKSFPDRRDLSIIRVLLDTGMRRLELADTLLANNDWDLTDLDVIG